jgi:hypothetical protein
MDFDMKKVMVWGVIIGVLIYVLWSRFMSKKQSYQKPNIQEPASIVEQIDELPEGVPPIKDD